MANEAENQIIGDWKTFTFHTASATDFPKINQHVRDCFLRGEPMNLLLGWDDQNANDHDGIVRIALEHGISFYLTEKGKNDIVACNLLLDSRQQDLSCLELKSPTAQKIIGLISRADEMVQAEFEAKFPCEYHAEIFISSVDPKFRCQGIATEMYRRTLDFLKAKGFPVLKVAFSAPGTRAIGKKLGFEEIGRLYYKDYVHKNGEKAFALAGASDEDCIAETAKYL